MEDWRYEELFKLEDEHWWFRARRRVVWGLLARAGRPQPTRMLDVGCGTGRNIVEFGGPDAAGVDVSSEAVGFCHRRGLTDVRQAPVEALPFDDGAFDLVLATDVIEHLEDDRRALGELRRVTAPTGVLVATVPAYPWLWSQHDVSMHHHRRYTRRGLLAAMQDSGWIPAVSTHFFAAQLPAVLAVRGLHKLRPEHQGQSDLALGPRWVNGLLEAPARTEAALIRQGRSIPVGSSIGVVGVPASNRAGAWT